MLSKRLVMKGLLFSNLLINIPRMINTYRRTLFFAFGLLFLSVPLFAETQTSLESSAFFSEAELYELINQADEESVVKIKPGTYVLRRKLEIDKSITIEGETTASDKNQGVVIKCDHENNLVFSADKVVLRGVRIEFGQTPKETFSGFYDAILVRKGETTLERCALQGVAEYDSPDFSMSSAGLSCVGADSRVVMNDSKIVSLGVGVMIKKSATGFFKNCAFTHNRNAIIGEENSSVECESCVVKNNYSGANITNGSRLKLTKSIFERNVSDHVFLSVIGKGNECAGTFEDCAFYFSELGINATEAICKISNCKFKNCEYDGIIGNNSNLHIEDCEFVRCRIGIVFKACQECKVIKSIINQGVKGIVARGSSVDTVDCAFKRLGNAINCSADSVLAEKNSSFEKCLRDRIDVPNESSEWFE